MRAASLVGSSDYMCPSVPVQALRFSCWRIYAFTQVARLHLFSGRSEKLRYDNCDSTKRKPTWFVGGLSGGFRPERRRRIPFGVPAAVFRSLSTVDAAPVACNASVKNSVDAHRPGADGKNAKTESVRKCMLGGPHFPTLSVFSSRRRTSHERGGRALSPEVSKARTTDTGGTCFEYFT